MLFSIPGMAESISKIWERGWEIKIAFPKFGNGTEKFTFFGTEIWCCYSQESKESCHISTLLITKSSMAIYILVHDWNCLFPWTGREIKNCNPKFRDGNENEKKHFLLFWNWNSCSALVGVWEKSVLDIKPNVPGAGGVKSRTFQSENGIWMGSV